MYRVSIKQNMATEPQAKDLAIPAQVDSTSMKIIVWIISNTISKSKAMILLNQ
jgi:hypothetical protein